MNERYLYHISFSPTQVLPVSDPPQQALPIRFPDEAEEKQAVKSFADTLSSVGFKLQGPNPAGMYRMVQPPEFNMQDARDKFALYERARRDYVHITEDGYARCVPVFGLLHAIQQGKPYFLKPEVHFLLNPDTGYTPKQPPREKWPFGGRPVLKKK